MPPRDAAVARGLATVAAVAVVAVGVWAQVQRPLAPPVGPPADVSAFFSPSQVQQARSFRGPVYTAGLLALGVRVGVAAWLAATAAGRRVIDRVVRRVGVRRPARAAAAVIAGGVVATDLLLAPLAFWLGYVHEGAYGLRTQGLGGWAYDWALNRVPSWLGVGVLALAGFALARRLPRTWPAVGGVTVAAVGVCLAYAEPLVLEPLEYRLTPLPAGPHRRAVEAVLTRAGEAGATVVVADASRRTTRQNAYLSGLGGSRRVVLYDTLVDGRPPGEVAVVVAHEVAHARHHDVLRDAALAGAGSVVGAAILGAVLARRAVAGRQAGVADPRAAGIVLLITLGLLTAGQPPQQWASRRAEGAADQASLDLSRAPDAYERLLVGLATTNLVEPVPPAWVTWLWGSHPPPLERLTRARRWRAEPAS